MNLLRETVISSEQFQKECQDTYFKLYYIFDVLNLLCLQGQLDRVPLMLNLDRQGKRVLASANFLKTPRQRKPFCFIEIRLLPCAALSTGCFLGEMLHEMNHIWDIQHARPAKHDKEFYDRMSGVGYNDKQMTFQENSLFAQSIDFIFRQQLQLRDGLNMLCSYPGSKPDWDEIQFYRTYLERVLSLKRRHPATSRATDLWGIGRETEQEKNHRKAILRKENIK